MSCVIQRSSLRATHYMDARGKWTPKLGEAKTHRSQPAAVRFGLRFCKNFFVFEVDGG